MPKTSILLYQEKEGDSPIVDWLCELKKTNRKGFAQCVGRISQLESTGYELRRPSADPFWINRFISYSLNSETDRKGLT